jgi:hypothetical protein
MVNDESIPAPSADVPDWKTSYTVPLDDDHPSCAQPADIEPHDDIHKTLDVVHKAYDWCIGADGRLYGLVSGDMGWAATSIVLTPAAIHENMKKLEENE